MTRRNGWFGRGRLTSTLACCLGLVMGGVAAAQDDELVDRSQGPPELDAFELDANGDKMPDGWYNGRDFQWPAEGGKVGPRFLRFHTEVVGQPARLSRAFGVDGSKYAALVLGVWVRQSDIQLGERAGAEPALLIQFYAPKQSGLTRYTLGPWTHNVGGRWTRVVKRLAVPIDAREAIMTIGLMGSTGTLDVDGLTAVLEPREGQTTTNLIVNGDFELGDPAPTSWLVSRDAHRVFPGDQSPSALELSGSRSFAQTTVAVPVNRFDALEVTIASRYSGLRGADGAHAQIYFLDEAGKEVGEEIAMTWSGSSGWRSDSHRVAVPAGAVRALLEIRKPDAVGAIRIDNVRVTASPNEQDGVWTPYHVADETEGWMPVAPSDQIAAGGGLDVSFLLATPAGRNGMTTVKDGRLAFSKGERARFLGVSLMEATAFQDAKRVDELADRLARSGINLVRLGELDVPLGPGRCLIDDSRDDTKALDPDALARLDHLIAALKKRGIYVAIELQSGRRYRAGDGVATPGLLPAGGGPAAQFDTTIGQLALETARALLDHVNPETGLALREDPVLAWVTLAGEITMFNQLERPDSLPPSYAAALRKRAADAPGGSTGRRLWEWAETEHSREMADALRRSKLRAPIASVSHWRRDPAEFNRAVAAKGIDLIDDRLYWLPRQERAGPERRTMMWAREGGLIALADRKRRNDRPYVVGQWCNQTFGAWSLPTESADYLLGVYMAGMEDWDAIVRRGLFLYPLTWGSSPAGLIGGEDIFQMPQVINASPHVYALFPHAASLFYRGVPARLAARHPGRNQRATLAGWNPGQGRLVIDTPYTQALAGWTGGESARLSHLELSTDNEFAVLAATSLGPEPIATAKRLLVTAIGHVEPTGLLWVDPWKYYVADPGRPPFLQEPVRARIAWRRKGTVRAFALNNAGERIGQARLEKLPGGEGVELVLDGRAGGFHWEIVAE